MHINKKLYERRRTKLNLIIKYTNALKLEDKCTEREYTFKIMQFQKLQKYKCI